MPLTQLTGALGRKRAAHLLRRTCFGGSISEIDTFAALTPAQAVQQLFDNTIPDPILPVDPLTGQEWVTGQTPATSENGDLERYFLSWNIGQMLGNGVNDAQKLSYIFRERLVFFMHSHFTTKRSTVGNARALYFQQALFRLYAFDQDDLTVDAIAPEIGTVTSPRNFKQLTKKICVDNAMLVFLDGRFNVEGNPNENYARELLELYSIGRGLEGSVPEAEFVGDYFTFTEEDVQAGARVLSGFNFDDTFSEIDPETLLPRGVLRGGQLASAHEEGTKSFSQRLGSSSVVPDTTLQVGGNSTIESVLDEISQLVDLIFDQQETAIHICRELYRFFVYHQIDDTLQNDIIQDMANTFIANDFKIQAVIEALLTSQHFYEAEAGETDNNFGSIIKSPLDLAIGYLRNFEVAIPDYATELDTFHEFAGGVLGSIGNQGMDYYEPFEVAGYSAYHQFPIFNRSWINPNYLTNRYNFIQESISNTAMIEMGQVNILQFVQNNFPTVAGNARDLIIAISEYFLPSAENLSFDTPDVGELTVERLNYFISAFLSNPEIDADPEGSWTFRWQNGVDDEVVANQLSGLFNAMLQTPEYQLM